MVLPEPDMLGDVLDVLAVVSVLIEPEALVEGLDDVEVDGLPELVVDVLEDGLADDVVDVLDVEDGLELEVDVDGLPNVEEDVLEDGLVVVELLDVPRADDLLIVRTEEQSSRLAPAEADALPTPLTLPETLALGAVWRQVMLTLSPLFRSLRLAAAFESTVRVRLLAAPDVEAAGFSVIVRAL